MPNGRIGDHPLTDVVLHGVALFGPEADGLMRRIHALGGMAELARESRLWNERTRTADVDGLRRLHDRLLRERGGPGA